MALGVGFSGCVCCEEEGGGFDPPHGQCPSCQSSPTLETTPAVITISVEGNSLTGPGGFFQCTTEECLAGCTGSFELSQTTLLCFYGSPDFPDDNFCFWNWALDISQGWLRLGGGSTIVAEWTFTLPETPFDCRDLADLEFTFNPAEHKPGFRCNDYSVLTPTISGVA